MITLRSRAWLGALLLVALGCTPAPPRNLVLISLDTLVPGRMSAYGNERPTTPYIDGLLGDPIANSVILIDGDTITAVGTVDTLPVPDGYDVISTEGMSVLPGLWDMHVHLMINGHSDYEYWDKHYIDRFESEIMPASAEQLLLAGVTTARDLGAPLDDSISVKQRIARGLPALVVSSMTFAPSASKPWRTSRPTTSVPRPRSQ